MKKTHPILTVVLLMLISMTACFDNHDYRTVVSGTLYTDSTFSTPIAHDTLRYYRYRDSEPLGFSVTDDTGAFAFSFWWSGADTWDDTYQSKFQFEYPWFMIKYKNDTLWMSESYGKKRGLKLYPGIEVRDYYF